MTKICLEEIETNAQKTEIDHSDALQHEGGGRVFDKKGVRNVKYSRSYKHRRAYTQQRASPWAMGHRRVAQKTASLEIETVQSRRRDPGLSLFRLPAPWIVSLRIALLLFRFHHTIADRAVSVENSSALLLPGLHRSILGPRRSASAGGYSTCPQ